MLIPPECEPLAEQLATLGAELPALRDAVGRARGIFEKLQAQRELAAQEHAVMAKQSELDACAGVEPPPPSVLVGLIGDSEILIDAPGIGWVGFHERRAGYLLTFSGYARSIVAITVVPSTSVLMGITQGGPFNLVRGSTSLVATRSGGVAGTFDQTTGQLEVPLFIGIDESDTFPGFWQIYNHREQAQASLLLSTETRLPASLSPTVPEGTRVAVDGKITLAGISTVTGGRFNGRTIAVSIDSQFFPWPLPS
jgi:hypothetical protein